MAKKSICIIDGCDNPERSGGLCNAHRTRLWRHGSATAPVGRTPQRGTIAERFWAFVDRQENGCWLWTGTLNNKGYGQISANNSNRLAHRISWEILNGTIPERSGILHRCDTPACVNPDHLFLGTQKTNMVDCKTKGRTTQGERNTNARLTAADVVRIRYSASNGESCTALAEQFSVSQSAISLIVARRRWAHIV